MSVEVGQYFWTDFAVFLLFVCVLHSISWKCQFCIHPNSTSQWVICVALKKGTTLSNFLSGTQEPAQKYKSLSQRYC